MNAPGPGVPPVVVLAMAPLMPGAVPWLILGVAVTQWLWPYAVEAYREYQCEGTAVDYIPSVFEEIPSKHLFFCSGVIVLLIVFFSVFGRSLFTYGNRNHVHTVFAVYYSCALVVTLNVFWKAHADGEIGETKAELYLMLFLLFVALMAIGLSMLFGGCTWTYSKHEFVDVVSNSCLLLSVLLVGSNIWLLLKVLIVRIVARFVVSAMHLSSFANLNPQQITRRRYYVTLFYVEGFELIGMAMFLHSSLSNRVMTWSEYGLAFYLGVFVFVNLYRIINHKGPFYRLFISANA